MTYLLTPKLARLEKLSQNAWALVSRTYLTITSLWLCQ